MASRSQVSFGERAEQHKHPLVKQLFLLAEEKKSNVVLSADVTTTEELLTLADSRFCLAHSDLSNLCNTP